MGRKEIIRSICEDLGLTQERTREIVQKLFEGIVQALAEEGRVRLRDFGVFEVKRRAPRTSRNPRTGETVNVPAKLAVTFKPGHAMQQRVAELAVDGNLEP